MVSVTARVASVKQPLGGYVTPQLFLTKRFHSRYTFDKENISPNIIGLVVDYLTRWQYFGNLREAFKISLMGAEVVGRLFEAELLLQNIVDLSDKSIVAACRVVPYDAYLRSSNNISYASFKVTPTPKTCDNIREMVSRSLDFLKEVGPITDSGFTFEGGFTDVVDSGDGDYLSKDMILDFKVSDYPPTKENTLQLAIYYILAKRSGQEKYKNIDKLGIFNPRLNRSYTLEIHNIPPQILKKIEETVVCSDTSLTGYESDSMNMVINNEEQVPEKLVMALKGDFRIETESLADEYLSSFAHDSIAMFVKACCLNKKGSFSESFRLWTYSLPLIDEDLGQDAMMTLGHHLKRSFTEWCSGNFNELMNWEKFADLSDITVQITPNKPLVSAIWPLCGELIENDKNALESHRLDEMVFNLTSISISSCNIPSTCHKLIDNAISMLVHNIATADMDMDSNLKDLRFFGDYKNLSIKILSILDQRLISFQKQKKTMVITLANIFNTQQKLLNDYSRVESDEEMEEKIIKELSITYR